MRESTCIVDLGYHQGKAVNPLRKAFPRSVYHAFEPNPWCHNYLASDRRVDFKWFQAADVRNCVKTMRIEDRRQSAFTSGVKSPTRDPAVHFDGWGSTLREDNVLPTLARSCEVPCLDFGLWLDTFEASHREVIVKMDIEGMEYDVLEHLISTGRMGKVHTLFCEFHDRFLPTITPRDTESLVNRVRAEGTIVRPWV